VEPVSDPYDIPSILTDIGTEPKCGLSLLSAVSHRLRYFSAALLRRVVDVLGRHLAETRYEATREDLNILWIILRTVGTTNVQNVWSGQIPGA
jgi:hypothetical protein